MDFTKDTYSREEIVFFLQSTLKHLKLSSDRTATRAYEERSDLHAQQEQIKELIALFNNEKD